MTRVRSKPSARIHPIHWGGIALLLSVGAGARRRDLPVALYGEDHGH